MSGSSHGTRRRRLGRRSAAALAVPMLLVGPALAAAGCQEAGPRPPTPTPSATTAPALRPEWRSVDLPAPPGPPGRLALRAAAACGDRWYVVGAVTTSGGETQPAAWRSPAGWTGPDQAGWQPLRVVPKTYYGERNVLYSAACHSGRLAAVGGKSGGAHGNPRVSTWRETEDGSLVEVTAPFELYGGPQAVNVGRMTSGPPGWLIVGNRMSGAAVWSSADATRFDIQERVPELASDERGETWASDAVAWRQGWLVAGGLIRTGRTDRDPLVWTSTDGRTWRRVEVPASEDFEELQRVALLGDTPVAVGPAERGFGAWRWSDDGWAQVGRFGGGAGAVPVVRSLVADPPTATLLAAVSDGTTHSLWYSADQGATWGPVSAPTDMPAGADRDVDITHGPGGLLLLVDDGRTGQAWFTAAPLPSD